MTECGTSEEEV